MLHIIIIPFALMWVFNGIIRGAGDTFITMLISISSLWGIRVPLAYYLSRHTPLGSNGIWVAMVVSVNVTFLLSLIYFIKGHWRKGIVVSENKDITKDDKQIAQIQHSLKPIEEGVCRD